MTLSSLTHQSVKRGSPFCAPSNAIVSVKFCLELYICFDAAFFAETLLEPKILPQWPLQLRQTLRNLEDSKINLRGHHDVRMPTRSAQRYRLPPPKTNYTWHKVFRASRFRAGYGQLSTRLLRFHVSAR